MVANPNVLFESDLEATIRGRNTELAAIAAAKLKSHSP